MYNFSSRMADSVAASRWNQRRIIIATMFLPVSPEREINSPSQQERSPTSKSLKDKSLKSSLIFDIETRLVSKKPSPADFDKNTPLVETNCGNPGLYNAVASMKGELGPVLWVGTLGASTDTISENDKDVITEKLYQDHDAVPIYLTDKETDEHYHQFCKQVLWKLFHYQFPDYMKPTSKHDVSWNTYVKVNQHFADKIVELYCPGDISTFILTLVWVNDYHLMMVPEMVRSKKPDATIGFFLHIPFPSSEIFRCLHVRKEILHGILGADLVGLQVYPFMRHFLMTSNRILGLDSTPNAVVLENSMVSVGSYPIGIDVQGLALKRQDLEVSKYVSILREKYAGLKVLIGRDKNDYVKGVAQKLLAFELFLETNPDWQGKVVLIQVSLKTSEANELETNVTGICSRINSRFGYLGYAPIVYLQQDISFQHYLALLTIADACIITSLRDGMNLTSHEYIVCQDQKHSPLIISEVSLFDKFAGTYGNFGAALRINPWDIKEVSMAIFDALVMSQEEKLFRWKTLYAYVISNTCNHN